MTSASEEQDMLLKISQLAGQINRHKNGQQVDHQTQFTPSSNLNNRGSMRPLIEMNQSATDGNKDYPHGWRPSRGGYPSRGYVRGGRLAPVHRNRSLVLNSVTPTSTGLTENTPPTSGDNAEATAVSGPGWVAKTGRHLQLINTSIYEKDTQNRAKAMEETRKQKLKQRNDREKTKLHKHIQRLGSANTSLAGQSTHSPANYEIDVQGVRFQVAKNGSKLVKLSGESLEQAYSKGRRWSSTYIGDLNAAKSTPKTAMVGGVRFHRTKNGNMYRSGIIKAYQKTGVIKKINEPCKAFSSTGSCSKGPRCRYIHDPSNVAVCKEFLQKGSCPSGDSCDLSHELTPQRTPACLHFARGNCSNLNCHYTHVRVSPSAPVCRPFGIYGYCEKGADCEERHVHECPDFSNTGKCTTKGCKLLHRHKASLMRTTAEEEGSDMSSDEDDEEIDDNDVDSDDLDEELLGDDGATVDSDIPMQRDYVQFS